MDVIAVARALLVERPAEIAGLVGASAQKKRARKGSAVRMIPHGEGQAAGGCGATAASRLRRIGRTGVGFASSCRS